MTNMAAGEELEDYESWEEMEDNGVLDRKLEKMRAAMSTSVQKELRSSGKPDTVVFVSEDGRTRYVPPEPTVKILKRPVVNNSHAAGDGFIMNGDAAAKPKQPIKTLQQREMEYAEARLRILGEAQSPEEKQSPTLIERIRRIQNKISSPVGMATPTTLTMDPSQLQQLQQQQQQQQQSLMCLTSSSPLPLTLLPPAALNNLTTAIVTMATASTTITTMANNYDSASQQQQPPCLNYSLLNHHHHHLHHQQQQHQHHLPNNHHFSNHLNHHNVTTGGNGNLASVMPLVLRQPRGPDGTKGFHVSFHR